MRKWTAAAGVRRGAAPSPVRYSDDGTALSAASPMAPAPSTTAKARMMRWPRVLGLTLGVWSVSYLARQALTWGSADMPFSPLGSFALEGIALAVVAIGALLGWSLVAFAALRHIEHATPAVPAQCVVIVPYPAPDHHPGSPRLGRRVCNPPPLPTPVHTGHPAWSPVRRAASTRHHRAAA